MLSGGQLAHTAHLFTPAAKLLHLPQANFTAKQLNVLRQQNSYLAAGKLNYIKTAHPDSVPGEGKTDIGMCRPCQGGW